MEQLRNQVARRGGPIVYCLESVDLPQSVNILDVFIRGSVESEAVFKPGLLGGVTALQVQPHFTHDPEWSLTPFNAVHLYKELTPHTEKTLNA